MRPRFTLWSNQGILTPKRRSGGSRFLGPIAACLVCAIGAGGVYSQIVAERGTVTTTGAGHAEQPGPPRQSAEPRSAAIGANARAGAISSESAEWAESAAKPEPEPRRIDVDVRQGLASPGSGGDHSATAERAQQAASGKSVAAKGSAAKGNAAKSAAAKTAAAKTATQELAEVKSEPADAAEANAAEGNADLGKSTAHGNATGKGDQKSRTTRPAARSGSNVQAYVTPDGREILVRRPLRGDGYAAFEPWDRNERSTRRAARSGPFDWFPMGF